MEKGLRYRISHMGDYMVDLIDKVSDAAKASAKGVILTYDIRDLRGKKKDILLRLGKRLTECRDLDQGAFVSRDEELTRLLEEFDDVQGKTEALLKDRNQRLYPPGATWSGKEPGATWSAKEPGASWSGKEPAEAAVKDVAVEPVEAVAEDVISKPTPNSYNNSYNNDDQVQGEYHAQDDQIQHEGALE
ncbi:MAG: hypothetical protein HQL02_08800 [Nitrospirae bacterium]|nr:hypothetical protein [Nitrospirota bacterium]